MFEFHGHVSLIRSARADQLGERGDEALQLLLAVVVVD
jgi:hypothetical protein